MSVTLDLAAVDDVFAGFWASSPAPGYAYGVVAGGELVHFGGSGRLAHGGPAPTPDSVFRVASLTKSFTAAALLGLRDEGRLSLDDPAARYVPALASLRGPTTDSRPITLRELATMSAGLPDDDAWADRQLPLPSSDFDALLSGGLSFASAPGTGFAYSNLGYAILGRAIASAADSDYAEVVTERLLRPLGMKASVFRADSVPRMRLAAGHRRLASGDAAAHVPWVQLPFAGHGEFAAIGGLYSSIADLAVWVGELADAFPPRDGDEAGHPLRRASRREMQQIHRFTPLATKPARSDRGGASPGDSLVSGGYGMGLEVGHDPVRGMRIGHPGGLPGFGSSMRWHPDTGIGVVALANSTYAPLDAPVVAALDALVDARPRESAPLWPQTLAAQRDVLRLLQRWDDTLAERLFADNVEMDTPLQQRRAALVQIREQLGGLSLDASAPLETSSPAQLVWWMAGERGRLRVAIALNPESPPLVQSLELTPWIQGEAAP
jgi:CubicO group peptidase (beta-lactamase class C family)